RRHLHPLPVDNLREYSILEVFSGTELLCCCLARRGRKFLCAVGWQFSKTSVRVSQSVPGVGVACALIHLAKVGEYLLNHVAQLAPYEIRHERANQVQRTS